MEEIDSPADLLAVLKERVGVDFAPVPDLGTTVKVAAALAALLALAVYMGE